MGSRACKKEADLIRGRLKTRNRYSSHITNRSIVYATGEYCAKLKKLRLNRIAGANRVSLSLTFVRKWTHIGETLRNLTLFYSWGANEEVAKLVETSFPRLRSLIED